MTHETSIKKTALVVEDEPTVAQTLSAHLRRHGFTVTSVGSIQEMREHCDRHRSDLIMLDIQLPDGSGLDEIERATEQHPKPPSS